MGLYLKKFENHTQYESYINGSGAILPNVSICTTERHVHYNPYVVPPHDYSQDYFTMVVTSGGDIIWSGSTADNTLSYSKDNGDNWSAVTSADTISVEAGDKVLWKGTPTPYTSFGIGKFSGATNVRYSVEGNTMSLLYGDDFKGQTSLSGKNYALFELFKGNTNVTSAENLSLPATTLATSCYQKMFRGCTSLTTAPVLSATTLAQSCYFCMFQNCTSLTTAPELPATTLAQDCYYYMFDYCTSLTTAPELPATTLANNCYQNMFSGCISLTTAPELPATTLAQDCYTLMFAGCTSLTTAPVLSATTLASSCYHGMFFECTGLTTVSSNYLHVTTLANNCYESMFYRCRSLTTAPELPATTLTNYCYYQMFVGCTSLNSIKCLATDISAAACTTGWVDGVAASGTFTKAASMTSWTTGTNGIPSGWAVQDAQ